VSTINFENSGIVPAHKYTFPNTRVLSVLSLGVLFATFTTQGLAAPVSPTNYADPMVGTAGHGHTFPGAALPFGMVQLSPDTRTETWDGCSGYLYSDSTIQGFSHTHLSGTGGGSLGDIMVMPEVGPVQWEAGTPGNGYASGFSHKQETAHPGYYKVYLQDPKVTAEMTATDRTGFHRYTFPATDQAHIIVDLGHGIQSSTVDTSVKLENDMTISGYRKANGWGGERTVFFVAEFSRPFSTFALQQNGQVLPDGTPSASGGTVKAMVGYTTKTAEQIMVKVGISATSVAGARKNLDAENTGWDFDGIRTAASKAWDKALGDVQIDTPDTHVKRTFYTNLYLSMIAPSLFDDVDRAHMGFDHKVHTNATFDNYTTFSLWDTYRAEHPLLNIIQPARAHDMVQAMLAQKRELGWHTTPIWPLWANETWCMIGYHSVDVIADAYMKGLAGPDKEAAYQDLKDTAMQGGEIGDYQRLGYVPSKSGAQATSKTIEYSYDDWCLAKMAESLGHKADADMFYKRALSYYNLFDRKVAFERGRKADGTWRAHFDPIGLIGDEYTEADAWQYAFGAQQDVPGMIRLYGGDTGFVNRLDAMFAASPKIRTNIPDITGLIGQYSQGDEQCHHVAYLYDYAGAPSKTQRWVREIMRREFSDAVDGECGNVDCGQMSAWYVFSAIGFYPVNPDSDVYAIGSPAVAKAVLHLDKKVYGGRTFTVVAKDNSPTNVYIQSATWDGKPYDKTYVTYKQITGGGTLALTMGPRPSPTWGKSSASRPPATIPAAIRYPTLPPPSVNQMATFKLPIHVACGTDDPIGNWLPDPNMLEGSTNRSGHSVDIAGVPGAAPEAVYQSELYGDDFTYAFPVPKGKKYTVRLHFAEVFDNGPGERIENVAVNGATVLPNFEIYKAAGGMNKAVVKEFTGVTAPKGVVKIRVSTTAASPDKNAKISGIEVLPE